MYSTCLFCNHDLGRNEVIETFPVGRRLAFDQAKGRLWVVCRKCEKWNLTPSEERWEAIEDCERRFRDAKKRVSSDNVGLARVNEGLELVRIGSPLRPEFAAWRYGDQFGRRRRKAILIGGGVAVAAGGLVIAGAATGVFSGGGWWMWQLISQARQAARRRQLVGRVTDSSGERLTIRGAHAEKARLVAAENGSDRWGLFVPHERGETVLHGDDARRAAAIIMPRLNVGGASRDKVNRAVLRIEGAGDPGTYLSRIAGDPGPMRSSARTIRLPQFSGGMGAVGFTFVRPSYRPDDQLRLGKLDLETRLAIEMAVNEEKERIALEGDLALLELEWKEAEEIAAIADTLGTPAEIDDRLAEMHKRDAQAH